MRIEHKDASGAAETAEGKTAIAAVMKAFEDFKTKNDERLAEITKKGSEDVVNKDTLTKLEARLHQSQTDFKKIVDDLEVKLNRKGLNEGGTVTEAETKAARELGLRCGQEITPETSRQYKAAMISQLRRGTAMRDPEEIKALSVGSDPDGGYIVHPDMSGSIAKLVYESSPMRQVASVVTISTDALEGMNDLDQAGAGWVEETGTRSESTTPQLGVWRIPTHELYAEPRATQKMLDDASMDIEAWLNGKVAERFGRLETTAVFTGNGTGRPRGFLTYASGTPAAAAFNVIERVVSGAAGAFAATDPADKLITLVYALKNAYRNNATFMMARRTLAEVRKLKDGNGQYIWQPDFTQKDAGALLGYTVTEAEDMPALASDSLSIAFGDFKAGYQIVDRLGVRILRDSFTAKPYVKFYTTKRVGGDVVNFEAIKLMKFATS